MDHDAVEMRLAKVERLLDAVQPGWREEGNWPKWRRAGDPEPQLVEESDLVVDEEQTKRDRQALGLDAPEPGEDLDPDGKPASGETPQTQEEPYLDADGNEWRKVDGDKWVTGEGEKQQQFVGSLDDLKVLTAPKQN